jgi:3-oxoacyl-[acyl-carrier protein] reductase
VALPDADLEPLIGKGGQAMTVRRTAVVTGGGNGIGAGIVRHLRAAGYEIAIVDIQDVEIEPFLSFPGEGRITTHLCDVADGRSVATTCQAILADAPVVSVLVNNAGGSGNVRAETVEDHSDEIWAHVGDLNLTSIIRFCRAFVPAMRAQRFGRIVNISSATRHGVTHPSPTIHSRLGYVTFKAAMVGLTRQLANDLGPDQITVNTVAPGPIFADADARIAKTMKARGEAFVTNIVNSIPLRRIGNADDIAGVVTFLASDGAGYLSGQTIDVCGGPA